MTSQLEPWAQLDDKVVMVTGASSGIGLEFCLDLAKSGCRIIAAARRLVMLESLCDDINRQPDPAGSTRSRLAPWATAVVLDVSLVNRHPLEETRDCFKVNMKGWEDEADAGEISNLLATLTEKCL